MRIKGATLRCCALRGVCLCCPTWLRVGAGMGAHDRAPYRGRIFSTARRFSCFSDDLEAEAVEGEDLALRRDHLGLVDDEARDGVGLVVGQVPSRWRGSRRGSSCCRRSGRRRHRPERIEWLVPVSNSSVISPTISSRMSSRVIRPCRGAVFIHHQREMGNAASGIRASGRRASSCRARNRAPSPTDITSNPASSSAVNLAVLGKTVHGAQAVPLACRTPTMFSGRSR